MYQRSHESWLLSDIDIFTRITEKMIVLDKMQGHMPKELKKEQWSKYIHNSYEYFPFLMMHNITEGDWKIAEKKD